MPPPGAPTHDSAGRPRANRPVLLQCNRNWVYTNCRQKESGFTSLNNQLSGQCFEITVSTSYSFREVGFQNYSIPTDQGLHFMKPGVLLSRWQDSVRQITNGNWTSPLMRTTAMCSASSASSHDTILYAGSTRFLSDTETHLALREQI